jgi:ParB family transcriptional regulator, chromosome partitioning protein
MSKLTDKAKAISFDEDNDPPLARAASAPKDRPRTAMGVISASIAMGRGVEEENRDLRAKLERFEDVAVVEFLDPKRIKPSRFANRHELSFAGSEFEGLKAEIQAIGRNVQPIKVRRVGQGADGSDQFEIAFGHRRHRACLELGIPVAAIVESLTDAQLFSEMERENRERQDLSPWEQGVMYKRAIDEGLFPSLRKMASSIGSQVGNISTAIQLASLPTDVVNAFPSPLNLQFRWGAALKAAIDKNPDEVLAHARELAALEPKLAAKDVFARLTDAGMPLSSDTKMLFTAKGKNMGFWDKDLKGNISIRIKAGGLSADQELRLRALLEKLFD